jgi:uroporphyrinogen decarboxylase
VAGTGYCLGTGNSVANYIPVQNYLAMLDEGRRWNRELFGAA